MTRPIPDPYDVVAGALRCKREELSADSSMYRDYGWDSFGHVRVVLAIEDALDTTIDDSTAMTLTSLKAIQDFFSQESGPGGA